MRELKFRAWDKVFKCWLQAFMIAEDGRVSEPLGGKDWTDQVEIMQYTGLKDKNGKEIYEGDIYQVAKNKKYEVQFITEEQYGEVVCGFGLYSKDLGYGFILDTYAIKEGEVIGNIYENKELLK